MYVPNYHRKNESDADCLKLISHHNFGPPDYKWLSWLQSEISFDRLEV